MHVHIVVHVLNALYEYVKAAILVLVFLAIVLVYLFIMIFYSSVFRELLKVQSKISYAKENEKNTIDT